MLIIHLHLVQSLKMMELYLHFLTCFHCVLLNSVIKYRDKGRTLAEAVSCWHPTTVTRVRARVWQVGFIVGKVASWQVFSEYFGFPCQNRSFHQLLHPLNHPGQVQ
jgi:hypothetical protein